MAIVRDLNRAFDSGNFVTWQIKLFLESLGWTTVASGSGGGGLFSMVGEVCTTPKYGSDCTLPTDWGWNYAWRVLESPSAMNEQWLFIRAIGYGNSNDDAWAVWYSPRGNFTRTPTNVPSATVHPECADQQKLIANTTAILSEKGDMRRYHFIGLDAPVGAGPNAYGFAIIQIQSISASPNYILGYCFIQDPFMNGDPADPAPWAVGVPRYFAWLGAFSWRLGSLVHAGLGSESWETVYGCHFRDGTGSLAEVNGVGVDSKERPLPMLYQSQTPDFCPGVSYFFFIPGVQRGYPQQVDGEDFVYISEMLLRGWDKTVLPMVP